MQGAGVTILGLSANATTPMPTDGVIQIAVDRYLLPSSVTRQAVELVDSSNQPLNPNVLYDPVARTVTIAQPDSGTWVTGGQSYKIRFAVPKIPTDPGLRAIDGAALAPGQPLEYAFNVVDIPDGGTPRTAFVARGEPDSVSFCKDVLPIFVAKCSAPLCHGSGGKSAASLVLDTGAGVANTARNRVAQGSNRGARAGTPAAPGGVFGIDMPIVSVDDTAHVGDAANSWLMYKIEIAPLAATPAPKSIVTCDDAVSDPTPAQAAPYTPLAPARLTASDADRATLSNAIIGNSMPYPVAAGAGVTAYDEQPLTLQERETIRMWIDRGAAVVDCGGCAETGEATDAGAGDAGAGDAGADAGP